MKILEGVLLSFVIISSKFYLSKTDVGTPRVPYQHVVSYYVFPVTDQAIVLRPTSIYWPYDMCRNQCVGSSEFLRPCSCDSRCYVYGNCCWDVLEQRIIDRGNFPPREHFQCRQIPGIASRSTQEYHVVSKCPTWADETTVEKCTEEPNHQEYVSAELVLPVVARNGLWFKNIHCARCNGVRESEVVQVYINQHCDGCPVSSTLELTPDRLVKLAEPGCTLTTSMAQFEQEHVPRPCSEEYIDDCSPDYQESAVIDACRNYVSPGEYDGSLYKNPHCALCNGAADVDEDFVCIYHDGIVSYYNPYYHGNIEDILPYRLERPPQLIAMNPPYETTTRTVDRLTECKGRRESLMTARIASDPSGLICPYMEELVALCLRAKGRELHTPTSTSGLQLEPLNNFSTVEPFPFFDRSVVFRIPQEVVFVNLERESLAQILAYFERSKGSCKLRSLEVLEVCGDVASVSDDVIGCDRRETYNSTEVVLGLSDPEWEELLDPITLEPLGYVSWYGFISGLDQYGELQTIGTQVCFINEQPINIHGDLTIIEWPTQATVQRRYPLSITIFSGVCIAISIISLLFTFVTYCLFGRLRNNFGIILMNFVGSLAMGELLIHFVTDYVTRWNTVCVTAAIAAHFFWLASFAWMNMLAFDLHRTFSKPGLSSINSRARLIGCFLYGWAVPFMVVGVCVVIHYYFSDVVPLSYGLTHSGTCWLDNFWVVFAVVGGPLLVTVLINGVIFISVANGIQKSRFRPVVRGESHRNRRERIVELVVYIKISLLLGFVWIVGFLSTLDGSGTLVYFLYIGLAIQGILIMVFFSLNKNVRSMWRVRLGCHRNFAPASSSRKHSKETSI